MSLGVTSPTVKIGLRICNLHSSRQDLRDVLQIIDN
jgi:hypothetical protein